MSEEKFEALRRAIVALQDNPTAGNCGAAIQLTNEIENSRTLSMQVEVPDLSESVCRGLLEIGFDCGVSASVGQFSTIKKNGGMTMWDPPDNPFRRASTAINTTCPKCKHSRAADGRCHSIGCECDCDNSDTARMPDDDARPKECTCPPGSPVHMPSCMALGRPR